MTPTERRPLSSVALPAAALVGAIAVWWAVTVAFAVPRFVLPPPTAVAARLVGNPALYVHHAVATLRKVLVGGVVGVVAGFAIALVVAFVPVLRRALYPYLVAARVLPKIAVAPVLLIYVGVGFVTAVAFVGLVVFFPMVISTAAGLDRAPRAQVDLLRSVDAGPARTFLAVRLPHALPDVFAGLKQSVTLAVVGAVVAEWILANDGLGYLVLVASENVQVDVMLASLSVLLAMGLGLYGVVALCQRRLTWQV
ncbi:MAG: ABC transporter permease [Haloplanus sp.]